MPTRELRSQVDNVWDSSWSDGIAAPLEVLLQITYLLFLGRLDELQSLVIMIMFAKKVPFD